MIVSNEKKKNGIVYPYFVCGGRHSKRSPDCKMKAVLIDVVEKKIEQIYDSLSVPPEIRSQLESALDDVVENERKKFTAELDGLQKEKAKLEHKRKKLLEAHYNDAIPLDLMKSEQKEIAKKLSAIDYDIKMHSMTFDEIMDNLEAALDMIEDCGRTYRMAPAHTKRLLNQAIFKRFLIFNGDEMKIDPELSEPFEQFLSPIKDDLAVANRVKNTNPERFSDTIKSAKRHIHEYFGCGASRHAIQTYSDSPNFFEPNSSSKDFLVEMGGVEPPSESVLTGTSPGAAGCLGKPDFPVPFPAVNTQTDPGR